jgi:hypothetical protein
MVVLWKLKLKRRADVLYHFASDTGTTVRPWNRKTCLETRARQPRSVSLARRPYHPDCGSGLINKAAPAAGIPSSYFSLSAAGAPYAPPV